MKSSLILVASGYKRKNKKLQKSLFSLIKGPDIHRQRINLRRRQFLFKSRHHTGPGFDGIDDLRVRCFSLPFGVRKILRSNKPAMKCMSTTVFAMAHDTIFLEQTPGIHPPNRVIGVFDCHRPPGCATANAKRAADKNGQYLHGFMTAHILIVMHSALFSTPAEMFTIYDLRQRTDCYWGFRDHAAVDKMSKQTAPASPRT